MTRPAIAYGFNPFLLREMLAARGICDFHSPEMLSERGRRLYTAGVQACLDAHGGELVALTFNC